MDNSEKLATQGTQEKEMYVNIGTTCYTQLMVTYTNGDKKYQMRSQYI